MTDPDDDLTAALRRDLAGAAVPHDDDRAGAMIRTATVADPLGARSWVAPLAAAAAVVVVGGGAAAIAAAHGGSGSPSGSAPVMCPAVSSSANPVPSTGAAPTPAVPPTPTLPGTTVTLPPVPTESGRAPVELQTLAPSTSATPSEPIQTATPSEPVPSATPSSSSVPEPAATALPSAEPCASPPNSSAVYPLPPSSNMPGSSTPATTSPSLPTNPPPTASEAPSGTTFVITADPGTTTSRAYSLPAGPQQTFVIELHRASGRGGSLRVSNESARLVLDTSATASATDPITHVFTNPTLFELSCTGTTICSVRVTLDPALPVGTSAATTTPSR